MYCLKFIIHCLNWIVKNSRTFPRMLTVVSCYGNYRWTPMLNVSCLYICNHESLIFLLIIKPTYLYYMCVI